MQGCQVWDHGCVWACLLTSCCDNSFTRQEVKESLQQGQRLFPSTGLILATVLRLEILAFFLQKNVVTRTGSEKKSLMEPWIPVKPNTSSILSPLPSKPRKKVMARAGWKPTRAEMFQTSSAARNVILFLFFPTSLLAKCVISRPRKSWPVPHSVMGEGERL